MKTKLRLVLAGLFLLSQAGTVWASTAFQVSATVPTATGITMVLDSVNATGTPVFTPATSLNFDTGGSMPYNSGLNIYLPDHYFALNVSASGGGSGLPDTTVTYAEGTGTACPNIAAGTSATLGCLGTKTSATFFQELGSAGTQLSPPGNKRLIDLTGTAGHVPSTSLASGSYLRIYVGVCTGNSNSDPSGCQAFTNLDAHGQYTGTLTVSATVV